MPARQVSPRYQPAHGRDGGEARPHRPLGVVLMRRGPAEAGQEPVALDMDDTAVELADGLGDHGVNAAQDLLQVLGIQAGRQRRRVDQIHEGEGEMPALGSRRVVGCRTFRCRSASERDDLGRRRRAVHVLAARDLVRPARHYASKPSAPPIARAPGRRPLSWPISRAFALWRGTAGGPGRVDQAPHGKMRHEHAPNAPRRGPGRSRRRSRRSGTRRARRRSGRAGAPARCRNIC